MKLKALKALVEQIRVASEAQATHNTEYKKKAEQARRGNPPPEWMRGGMINTPAPKNFFEKMPSVSRNIADLICEMDVSEIDETWITQFLELKRKAQRIRDSFPGQMNPMTMPRFHTQWGKEVGEMLEHASEKEEQGPVEFNFMHDVALKEVAERDYQELLRLAPKESPKSAIILCGSILECFLFDLLIHDKTNAMASTKAPKKSGGVTRDIESNAIEDQWNLKRLIQVACDLGHLDNQLESLIDKSLRDFRNFVHPRAELNNGMKLDPELAAISVSVLGKIISELA